MTREEAKQILEDYVKACREDDFFKIETGFTYEKVIEAMDMGAKSLLSHSLPFSLDEAAEKYDECESWRFEALKYPIRDAFKAGAQHATPRWISVDERLPEMDEEVIVLTDELGTAPIYKIAFGHIVDVERCIDYNGWNCPGVKYWMPCPKIPNNDSNKKNMRIPFDISKRPQIESGEYKVVYVENSSSEQCPVEILKWDSNSDAGCIIGCVRRKGKDRIYVFDENGEHKVSGEEDRLFIVTPEPEMSEMEISMLSWLSDDTSGEIPMERMKQVVKARAAELLATAKQQLLQSGELMTQEHHEKLMETLREECKKDLPRWRKCEKPFDSPSNCGYNGVNLINHGYALSIDDAYTKLPKDE